jgi:hypothetical protein
MEGEGIKENGGGGEFKKMYLIYCKNFWKCHSAPHTSTKIKKTKNLQFAVLGYSALVSLLYIYGSQTGLIILKSMSEGQSNGQDLFCNYFQKYKLKMKCRI